MYERYNRVRLSSDTYLKQAQLRKLTKGHGALPHTRSVRQVIYLALMKASERWSMPIREGLQALYHFSLVFPDRVLFESEAVYIDYLTLPGEQTDVASSYTLIPFSRP